jgi:HK97 gp10 family phage protein
MMAESIEFSLIGIDSLVGKLQSINYDVKRKGGRSALRRAAQLVAGKWAEGVERLDDKETGRSIAQNIAVRWNGRRFRSTGDLAFRVGVLHGAVLKDGGNKAENSPTPHWRLLEFGTENIRAQPYARNALADNISAATGEFISQYEKAIDRAIRRAQKARGMS